MKQIVLSFIAVLSLFFSSCLGNDESTFSGANQLGVVNVTSGGTKYLATSNYWLTFDELTSFSKGDAIYLTYFKGSSNNLSDGAVIKINDYTKGAIYPVSAQKNILVQTVDTAANVKSGIGLRSISVLSNDTYGTMLDKNLLNYSVSKKNGEEYLIDFYYDKDKQVDNLNVKLSSNRAVVDVVLTRRMSGSGDESVSSENFVLDASKLKAQIKPSTADFGSSSSLIKYVDFRYSIYDTSTKTYKRGYASSKLILQYYPSSN